MYSHIPFKFLLNWMLYTSLYIQAAIKYRIDEFISEYVWPSSQIHE